MPYTTDAEEKRWPKYITCNHDLSIDLRYATTADFSKPESYQSHFPMMLSSEHNIAQS
jgi:hypothetical protein